MKAVKLIIAGGGTGGHIFPAVAIANAVKKMNPQAEILFIGAKGKMEMEKVPQAGYDIEGLDIVGFDRSSLIKNIGLTFKLIRSFLQVRKIFSAFKPDAVIGVGGYSSFPVLRYAQQKGIPTFIHESNSFAGKSNILLGRKASKIFVATEGMEKFFPASRIIITGNPVRSSIASSIVTREEGIRFFGLDPQYKTILSMGGSLGAKSINEAIEAGLQTITASFYQVIWQTGVSFAPRAKIAAAENRKVWTGEFIREIDKAFAAADIVVSRAGAMAIAELCLVGKPAIFVPYPFASEDHQTVNAKTLVDRQAGILIKDNRAKEDLVDAVMKLANDTGKTQALEQNIKTLGKKNADQEIAKIVLDFIGRS